jgi:S-adenosylmethionine:tRNA ribosyltransferase-isomerase
VDEVFNYELQAERIAQWPAQGRSSSKLLHYDGTTITDGSFTRLPGLLKPGSLLILNDSQVVPSRFFPTVKGREAEVLLLTRESEGIYQALARPMTRFKQGEILKLSERLEMESLGRTADGSRLRIRLSVSGNEKLEDVIREDGGVPIPPYIRGGRGEEKDKELYQTVFAEKPGSVAAPTAGLHFTKPILDEIESRGVTIARITLHVGSASFRPAAQQDATLEQGDEEFFKIPLRTAELLESHSGHVIAVGTTTTRALESYAAHPVVEEFVSTRLLVKPGHRFRLVNKLITNFHQPGSTHLLLVQALAGLEGIKGIYRHASENDYRFLSYGDSMFIDI